jgi:hypothetical protein
LRGERRACELAAEGLAALLAAWQGFKDKVAFGHDHCASAKSMMKALATVLFPLGVGVPVDGGVTDGVTVDGGVTVGALEADAPEDSDAEGVTDALTDAVAELVGVGGV